jgi:hypothetical protein
VARKLYTVQEIATSVRARLDEMNRDSIDDERDILPALNRALEYAVDIYSRHYPDPYIASTTVQLVNGQQDYDIPEEVFEDRVIKVDLKGTTNYYQDIVRVSYRDLANYETEGTTATPFYYATVGRKLHVLPTPTDTYSLRIWYVKNPEQLVLPQGRVTVVGDGSNQANNYVVVDTPGSQLTTESDQLESYVNVINSKTGEIRATLQIASIDDGRVTFRSFTSRTEVLGRTVGDSVAGIGVTKDDYLCICTGICVPYLSSPTSNFVIQFAIAELSRQLGVNGVEEEQVLQKFEDQVKKTWAGREPTTRIAKRSQAFGTNIRKWQLTQRNN